MRVHIISDMEGVAGLEQTTGVELQHEEGLKLYTQEINAAARGAKTAARPRSWSCAGVELLDARTIVSCADTWREDWKQSSS